MRIQRQSTSVDHVCRDHDPVDADRLQSLVAAALQVAT